MAMNKTQRRAAGKKGVETRRRNAAEKAALADRGSDPHEVDQGVSSRTTEQDAMQSYGISRDAHDEPWKLPTDLDAPDARAGYTQRWIRVRVGNNEDAKNSMKKFREGWLPRSVETVPTGYAPPTFLHPRLGDVIGVDDLILCEMPIKKARQRNAYYRGRQDRMVQGISNDLRKIDSHGPRIDNTNKTRVTKHRLRVPEDPADE